jgi:serine/threonine protein kinase
MLRLIVNRSSFKMLAMPAVTSFTFQDKIGEGGYFNIYKERLPNGEIIAVKILKEDSPVGKFLILNEINVLSRLRHPNIIGYRGYGRTENGIFLAIEYVDAKDLNRHLDTSPHVGESVKKLSVAEALYIAEKVASALVPVHAMGRVQGDVKPENILWRDTLVKLLDFSTSVPEDSLLILKTQQQARLQGFRSAIDPFSSMESGVTQETHELEPFATPVYIPLDRILTGRASLRSDDIWAWGATLYEMLSGEAAVIIGNDQLNSANAWTEAHRALPEKIENLACAQPVKDLLLRTTEPNEEKRFSHISVVHSKIKKVSTQLLRL